MDHNEFYRLLRDRGWHYDNGWSHDSISWDCYAAEAFPGEEYFVVLSMGGAGRLLRITKTPLTKTEVWAGPLSNEAEIDALMSFRKSQTG